MNLKLFLFISCITGIVISCGGSDSSTNPDENDGGLLPASALSSGCFNWPAQEFSPTHRTSLTTSISKGQPAVDFTLMDVDSTSYTLSVLLETKPVLMVFGSYT